MDTFQVKTYKEEYFGKETQTSLPQYSQMQ